MQKISSIALVGLCVILACGCVDAGKPTSIEIVTNNSGVFDNSNGNGKSIEEVYVVLYDSNGNSVRANGLVQCSASFVYVASGNYDLDYFNNLTGKSMKKSGETKVLNDVNMTVVKLDDGTSTVWTSRYSKAPVCAITHTQYNTFETDSNQYVRLVTHDVYLALVYKILHETSHYGEKYSSYDICDYVRTTEDGFKSEERDVMTNRYGNYTGEPTGNTCGSYNHLFIEMAFIPADKSTTLLTTNKILTA